MKTAFLPNEPKSRPPSSTPASPSPIKPNQAGSSWIKLDQGQATQPQRPMNTTRNGKMARLPKSIRHQLNRRLEDGQPGNQLEEVSERTSTPFLAAFQARSLAPFFGGGDKGWEIATRMAEAEASLEPGTLSGSKKPCPPAADPNQPDQPQSSSIKVNQGQSRSIKVNQAFPFRPILLSRPLQTHALTEVMFGGVRLPRRRRCPLKCGTQVYPWSNFGVRDQRTSSCSICSRVLPLVSGKRARMNRKPITQMPA